MYDVRYIISLMLLDVQCSQPVNDIDLFLGKMCSDFAGHDLPLRETQCLNF